MKIERDFVPLFRSVDGLVRRLPLMRAEADESGPTVFLGAAIHGNEVNGIAVIYSLFKKLERERSLRAGKIVALPILNPLGFELMHRHEPYEEADLNRLFPGEAEGDYPQRLAATIFSLIRKEDPEFVLDLHTDSMNSIAYTIVDFPKNLKSDRVVRDCLGLATDLGFHFALDSEEAAGYPIEKSLSGALVSAGIKAVTIELGGPWVISEAFRKLGVSAIWRLLARYGMVAPEEGSSKKKTSVDFEKILVFKDSVKIQSTGIVEFRVSPGQETAAGQVLGKVRDVFGRTIETIVADAAGVVFSHDDWSVAFPGKSLFTIAYPESFAVMSKKILAKGPDGRMTFTA